MAETHTTQYDLHVQALVGRTGELDSRGANACLRGISLLPTSRACASLVSELDGACGRLLPISKPSEISSFLTSFADIGHPAPHLNGALSARQPMLLRAFEALRPKEAIGLLWAATVHGSYARLQFLVRPLEHRLYNLSPSYVLPEEALIRLYQVCEVQEQLTGRRILPRGCTLFQTCVAAYHQRVMQPLHWSASNDTLFTACDVWASGVHAYISLQQDASKQLRNQEAINTGGPGPSAMLDSIHALPHSVSGVVRHDLPKLGDALKIHVDSLVSSREPAEPTNTVIVAIPQQWRVEMGDTAHSTAGHRLTVTGFAWMELAQVVARQPGCRLLNPNHLLTTT
eukprot:jgi/Ulvmu1/10490/UM064_0027.1